MRLSSSPLAVLVLLALLGWGIFDDWFDQGPQAVEASAVQAGIEATAARAGLHAATAALYARSKNAPLWRSSESRAEALALLDGAASEGVEAAARRARDARRALGRVAGAEARWEALTDAARDTLADPRPAALAAADLALTDGLVRYGEGLSGSEIDARKLYPGTWFPTVRDSTGSRFRALQTAVASGRPAQVARALDGLRPHHAGYDRLRRALAALDGPLPPVPDGAPIGPGEHSVRIPHARGRLAAFGYLPAPAPDSTGASPTAGWQVDDPYLFDPALASALIRFRAARGLSPDTLLDDSVARALNGDVDSLRTTLAVNLERWRWLPDDLGDAFLWMNLPAFELRAEERQPGGSYREALRMAANIGNAMTTGWTTPVITDSVHTVEFQPAWYVPASLAASNVFPMAQADSLALWRQGFEVYQNGRPVDSRLVPWDSVSVGQFRFVQRPGPANPLGRVKFLMHNPYAILIHDTNKRQSFADGAGSSMSSGCVHAGDPAGLAEYLLTRQNGWKEGEATAAWRGGPRRGVRLERPFLTHFVYFTAEVDDRGALVFHADPYHYDARLAAALRQPETDRPVAARPDGA